MLSSAMQRPRTRNTMPDTSAYYHVAYTIAFCIYAGCALSLNLRRKRLRAK
jgi:hypothetical protein